MGGELSGIGIVALRELGRAWNRIIWSVLFVIALMADVWAALYPSFYPWSYPWSDFLLGLLSGIAFSGLATTLLRRRNRPSPPEDARTR